MAFYGTEYITTGTATPLSTITGFTANSGKDKARQIVLRTVNGAGVNYFGPASLTLTTNRAGSLLGADSAPTVLGSDSTVINLGDIYLVGDGTVVTIALVS